MFQATEYQCTGCGGLFPPDVGYNDNGAFICRSCFAAREAAVNAAKRGPIPAYSGILRGAALLNNYASLLTSFGVISIVVATTMVAFIVTHSKEIAADAATLAAVVLGGVAIAAGFFIWSTVIRMFAELAAAHRDIARNSFKR